jgi:thiol-disulfide isomerase/thioredoxin
MRRLVLPVLVVLVLWYGGCDWKRPGSISAPNANFRAHEIEGVDSQGKPLRLSDYQGKVVLLDFWASWCGPCMGLVPHEKALVKSHQGKPFVLLGVSADNTLADLKTAEEENQLPWRSWWDGDRSLQRQWDVKVLPTLFLIDHEGIVRYRFEGGGRTTEANVEAALKDLLGKVPGKQAFHRPEAKERESQSASR